MFIKALHNKKILLAISFSVLVVFLIGCNIKGDEIKSYSFLTEYDEKVFRAEKEIIGGNYENAGSLYLSAIEAKDSYVKSKDLYNALISSIKYKNYEDACYFLDLLIRKGGDLNIVVTIDGDFEFQNSLAYKLYLKSQYELSRKFWLSHHNFELRSNIVSLVKHDQREYCNTIGLLEEVSEKNTDEFINLLENSVLPSEDEIGGISINDSLPIILPIYTPLIIHAFQNGDESFYKPIMNSFRNGIISPEVTAFLLQFSSSTNLPKCVLISCNGDLYEKLFDKKLESEYNTVRRNLSLCPHDFEIEKLIFNAKKSDFLIFAPNCKYGSENEFYKEGYVMIK